MRQLFGILLLLGILPVAAEPLAEAFQAIERRDYPTAHALLLPLAKAGNAEAQFQLGQLYHYGRGVPEDDVAALGWFERAARQGSAKAQYELGNMYAFGFGVVPDDPNADRKAAKWYFEAARQGHPDAQYGLGILFLTGKGVRPSHEEALKWMRRAAAQGHRDASLYLRGSTPPK